MKQQELSPEIELSKDFKLCIIEGEEAYVDDTEFQEFEDFTICFDLGIKDKHGYIELLMLKVTREQWYKMLEDFKYEVFQKPESIEQSKINEVLSNKDNIKKIEEAITDFANKYESQGFDD